MSKIFNNQNQNFLYLDTKHNDTILRQSIAKINVNVKSDLTKDVTESTKKEEKNPTPREVLTDYLESTSVHGLQYFGKTNIEVGVLGKILWAFTILTCFVCTCHSFEVHHLERYTRLNARLVSGLSLMLMQFLRRYNENPTNTYIQTFDAPIFRAPFPAVTICPSIPIPLKKRLAILENSILPENVSRELALEMLNYGHLITHPYMNKEFKQMDKLKEFLDANKWSVARFVKTLINCEDMFESCWWSTERIDCTKSIKHSYSSYGLCCSFNYLLENYVGSQKGQPKPKPLSSADFGLWSGLKLVFNKEMFMISQDDMRSSTRVVNSNGMVVLIHHRMDYPGLNTNMYTLQVNHELEIAIKPELIQKPAGLQHRNKEKQLVPVCIAEDQNTLEYFSVYRYSNCYANCRVKAMIRLCGCLPFIYDNIAESYNISRCEIEHLPCIQRNAKLIGIVKDIQNENFTCSCRTPCENMNYDNSPNLISLTKASLPNTTDKGAAIKVYMYSQTFQMLLTLSAADETYLLASVGGIFSLFLGCSFLSVVEIVYFVYLYCRAIFAHKRHEVQTDHTTNEIFVNGRRRVY
ncbi:sodium channel protein Nach isoform X1 [Bombus vancouverensis nearcticus]|uniref:Sodium channel protein Nach-like isoform X1 n=1 Tax=Bombus bifarius TaxID=103933 RepID=A0A6P8LG96_9HYME|nr:sodium channel protein Nach-like isoform X1 [Bombus bifarius]XP_033299201.1 sodium channel protein Nach-like isoform X1 [Bombus bifarius]